MTMNGAAWFLIGTTLGSAVGVGVTYIYLKDKYEERLNEEVNALKTHYVERDRKIAKRNEEEKKKLEEKIYSDSENEEFVDYTKMYVSTTPAVIDEIGDVSAASEIISDMDWDDPNYDNYRKITVDYFEDGAAFESLSGEEIDGFESIVGEDFKTAFGEYTPNVVYVRNHELRTDYEIIEQEGSSPHPEDE